eukprot:gene5675-13446_t
MRTDRTAPRGAPPVRLRWVGGVCASRGVGRRDAESRGGGGAPATRTGRDAQR